MNQSYLIGLLLGIQCLALSVIAEGFSENRTVSLESPRVVIKVNGRLAFVSLLESGSIEITSPEADFSPCKLSLDESLHTHWGTTTLGNGNIIVWNRQASVYYKGYFTDRQFTVIDPVNCTFTTVKRDAKEGSILGEIRAVLPYQDSFDMFSENNDCTPCRYNNDGTPIDLPQSIYKQVQIDDEDTFIKPIGDNAESGYLFIQRFSNCSTLLKILSPKFEVLEEHLVDRYYETVSTDYGQIRFCSSSTCLRRDNVTHDCQLLDFKLKSDKPLERVTEGKNTFLKVVQNLPDGGAISAFVNQEGCLNGDGEGSFTDVYIKKIRSDGHVESEQKFETLGCLHYVFENFLLQDGKYCLIAYNGISIEPYPQAIKCLNYPERTVG